MNESDIRLGYVYHIKDLYFDVAKDDKLMRNHEGGAKIIFPDITRLEKLMIDELTADAEDNQQ